MTDSYTLNEPGYWVDVCIDNQGPEGMPSYMLEIVDEASDAPDRWHIAWRWQTISDAFVEQPERQRSVSLR